MQSHKVFTPDPNHSRFRGITITKPWATMPEQLGPVDNFLRFHAVESLYRRTVAGAAEEDADPSIEMERTLRVQRFVDQQRKYSAEHAYG